MWGLILNDYSLFQQITAEISKWLQSEFETKETPFGAHLTLPKDPMQSAPIIAQCEDHAEVIQNLLISLHRERALRAFVHCDFANSCMTPNQSPERFIPTLCARSVGRLDIGGTGQVLYEEIYLNSKLLRSIDEALGNTTPSTSSRKLFSPERELENFEHLQWIHRHTGCEMSQHAFSSLINTSTSLGIPAGGLYYDRSAKAAHKNLLADAKKLLTTKDFFQSQ